MGEDFSIFSIGIAEIPTPKPFDLNSGNAKQCPAKTPNIFAGYLLPMVHSAEDMQL
jgi:hypothetical protein